MYSPFPQRKMYTEYKSFPQKQMYQGKRVFLKKKIFRVHEFSSKENVFGVQKFSSKVNVLKYKSFPQKICIQGTWVSCIRSTRVFLERKMYSPKKTWLRYRVWRWRLFSSGWKEAVNLRLNHSICWKILKIFRKICKCKYKYKYDWRNRSLRAVWKSSHILSTRGTFGRPLNWTWRLKILKTICDGLWQ